MQEDHTELHICRLCDGIFISCTSMDTLIDEDHDLCDKSICRRSIKDDISTEYVGQSECGRSIRNKSTRDDVSTEYVGQSDVFAKTEAVRNEPHLGESSNFAAAESKLLSAKHETIRRKKISKWCICDECHARFDDTITLNTHINAVHDDDKRSWDCHYCSAIFGNVRSLCKHKQLHWMNDTFSCEECSAVFYDSYELKNHVLRVHHEPFKFQCTVCYVGFPSHEEALTHSIQFHDTDAVCIDKKSSKLPSTLQNLIRAFWYRIKCSVRQKR